ncbi:MAG: ATP-binding protein [Nitrospiraceae bacterium]|nr:ATP-binding protein [Nitrospiraceae bacterium]
MKRVKTFRRRIFTYIVILISAISLSFAFVYLRRERTLLESGLESRGNMMCSVLAGSSRLGLFSGNTQYLSGPLKGMLEQKEVLQAAVYGQNGNLLANDSKKAMKPGENPVAIIDQLKLGNRPIHFNTGRQTVFWAPVMINRSNIGEELYPEPGKGKVLLGFVQVVLDRSEITAEAYHTALSAILLAVAFIIVGGVAAYFATERLIGPLKEFVISIKKMSLTGIEKTPVTGDAEITVLAEAFNSMVDELALKEGQRQAAEGFKNQLAAAVESTNEAVIISDPEGKIVYLNPAFEQMTGYQRGEALGQGLTLPAAEGPSVQEIFARAIRERSGWTGKCSGVTKKGDYFLFEGSISPVKGPNGEISNYVMVQHDITEREKLESVAQSVELMNNIGYIFSGIRHEIGNPLQSIKMTVAVFLKALEKAPAREVTDYVDYLGRIQEDMARIEFLLKSLKSFNIYEQMELAEVDLNDYLAEFTRFIRADFDRKGIRVELDSKPGLGLARIDPRAMQQILLNLVINSADAMKDTPSPRIDIFLSRAEGDFIIMIQDNGAGMTEQQKKEIFKPFYTTKQKGTGLGLVLVKKMLLKMGGDISVASWKDKGTSVIIRLPAV